MGIAIAPVVTGVILYYGDWRLTFLIPGIVCVLFGILFFLNITQHENNDQNKSDKDNKQIGFTPRWQQALFALALSTASGGFLFGAMSFLLPRYFELHMQTISTNVAITGILAGVVFACASFAQMAVGWLIDRISPRLVLFWIALGQVIFIYLASQFENLSLFFLSMAAMCFVFGQIPITDTILDGVTRKSILEIAKSIGLKVEVRPLSVDELVESSINNSLEEMFGCGTAVVVNPIKSFGFRNKKYILPINQDPISSFLKEKIISIQ